MTDHTLDPRAFIGCGVTLGEWVQLTEDERTAFVTARDELMERQAEMIVDAIGAQIEEAVEDQKLADLAEKVATGVGA